MKKNRKNKLENTLLKSVGTNPANLTQIRDPSRAILQRERPSLNWIFIILIIIIIIIIIIIQL